MSELTSETITFGKYKDQTLKEVLKDRKYSEWLLKQEWFQTNYEYLFNRIQEYDPKSYFLKPYKGESEDFLECYQYFNLYGVDEVNLELTEEEKVCYSYYLEMIDELKHRINMRLIESKDNIYDIKAPVKWLQNFECITGIRRNIFKEFMSSYDLPNIPYIIEDIKKQGGIVYKGAQSFNIAKKRSLEQEAYWEEILKDRYGEDLGTQFKYENCIFDFINISTNTIYECKLSLKDFNEEQHRKYLLTLNKYRIIYLIDRDCIIVMEKRIIYTTDEIKYRLELCSEKVRVQLGVFYDLIKDFEIEMVEDIKNYLE